MDTPEARRRAPRRALAALVGVLACVLAAPALAARAPQGAGAEPSAPATRAFDLLDNGDFTQPPPAPSDGAPARVPWWVTTRGAAQLAAPSDPGSLPVLVTAPGEVARQPLAAWAPALDQLVLSGEVAGPAVLVVRDGAGREARVELNAATGDPEAARRFTGFRVTGADLAAAAGGALVPRLELRLAARTDAPARWRGLSAEVALPAPEAAELRAEILAKARWILERWFGVAQDDIGPRETAFLCHVRDVVSGERLDTLPATGYSVLFELLLRLTRVADEPEWDALLDAFLSDFLELGLHPETGLPRAWDPRADEPLDGLPQEIALPLGFLVDVAEGGPERWRDRAREAALRIAETVLDRGVLPDGTVAASYVPADGRPNLQVNELRRLDVPAQLARIGAWNDDRRCLDAARQAVAEFEYTNYWAGTWDRIDPGFDDRYGHYGARAATMWTAWPAEPTFRRVAQGGLEHFLPLWRDALRLGGNVAADQVRCWEIAADVARLEPAVRPRLGPLLRSAARLHFKGEQYGNGAWGDVSVYLFDPKTNLQVGDLSGTPQNLLHGLADLHARLAAGEELPGLDAAELRAMFTAVMRSTVETYERPHGYLTDRAERAGYNVPGGSIRMLVGLVRMLESL